MNTTPSPTERLADEIERCYADALIHPREWIEIRITLDVVPAILSALRSRSKDVGDGVWPKPKITNPDIPAPTGHPYFDCLLHRLLDAQQTISLAANEDASQSLCDASSVIDEVEVAIYRLSAERSALRGALEKIANSDGRWVCEPGDATRKNYIGSLRDVARAALPHTNTTGEG